MGDSMGNMFDDHPPARESSRRGPLGVCGRLVTSAVSSFRHVWNALLYPFRLWNRGLDDLDERRARGLRADLGRRRCLVSWHHVPEGGWRARLSGPGLVVTIERSARRRSRAIARATQAMDRILAHHAIPTPKRREKHP